MKCVTGRKMLRGLPGQCHPGDQSNFLIILVSILECFIILSNILSNSDSDDASNSKGDSSSRETKDHLPEPRVPHIFTSEECDSGSDNK